MTKATFYRLNLLNPRNPDFCVLQTYPEGMGLKSWKLCRGEPVPPEEYPENAQILMSDSEPGMQVPDLVSNTCNLLIVSRRVKEAFEAVNQGPVQFLPITIINHKKRPASNDHFIVNPLGTVDILDTKASKIVYLNGEVVKVDTYVVDPQKAQQAPDLFRVKENPEAYVISQRIADGILKFDPKPTNMAASKMEPSSP